jgi:acetyl-CoA decarbonylase/synthase complex subunit delta
LERIVIYPTTGGLGYGFEYAYSIMERARISGLNGDKMLALPILCMVGSESWKAKEAKSEEVPAWGDIKERGPLWEATTGCGFLQAGADILIMRHPKAAQIVKEAINELMEKKED